MTTAEGEESCFSRAVRAIRGALSWIRGDDPAPALFFDTGPVVQSDEEVVAQHCPESDIEYERFPPPEPDEDIYSDVPLEQEDIYEVLDEEASELDLNSQSASRSGPLSAPPPRHPSVPQEPSKRRGKSPGGKIKYFKGCLCFGCSTDSLEDKLCEPGATMQGRCTAPGSVQGIFMEINDEGGFSNNDLFSAAGDYPMMRCFGTDRGTRKYSRASTHPYFRLPKRKDKDDVGPRCKSVRKPSCSQSMNPSGPQGRPAAIQDSASFLQGGVAQDACEFFSAGSESEPGGGRDVPMETDAPVAAVNYSVTSTLPAHNHLPPPGSRSDSSCLSRSHSMPSLSRMTSVENETFRRAESSPDLLFRSSFQDFTPDEHDETYRLQCSCPGLYRCSVTGLLFHMCGEGDVVYRTVPWDRRLLARHRKKPAGPLFEIQCEQRSVCGLHLPHCEIRSAGGCDFLSVAHVKDEGVEFIDPRQITETHVVIDITGFSAFGNVKDEDSPPDPVRALVLLFYRPPADPHPKSLLNVLLLPRNVMVPDVLRIRKKLVGDESYIEMSPHCKLNPEQEYTLSTCPEDDRVLVQPTEAEFDSNNYDIYFPSFQVTWETTLNHMKLLLRDTNSSHSVWERQVCLSVAGVRRSSGPERLLVIRTGFIDRISEPVLKSLLDKLFERTVITDAERESADERPYQRDKARFVIDTVRKKGEAASSEMIKFLCEADPFLCKDLGLI